MARVSLILPVSRDDAGWLDRIATGRRSLECAGHCVVEVIVAGPLHGDPAQIVAASHRRIVTGVSGLTRAAIEGMQAAVGDVLLVVDPEAGYDMSDLARVVAPVARGEAELVVASRFGGRIEATDLGAMPPWRLRSAAGTMARPLAGSADPMSGLVAIRRESLELASASFRPVGSRFTWELLAKAGGRRVDVPVRRISAGTRTPAGWDDLKHLKHLADYRFGNFSRLFQFCVVGASGMVVDLTCYAAFQWVLNRTWMGGRTIRPMGGSVDLSLATAGAAAIGVALIWNFSLNRRLTFNDARRGSQGLRQFLNYALSNALGVALSYTLRLVLPGRFAFFHDHKLAAAVVGIVAATGISFSMARWFVFGRPPAAVPPVELKADAA